MDSSMVYRYVFIFICLSVMFFTTWYSGLSSYLLEKNNNQPLIKTIQNHPYLQFATDCMKAITPKENPPKEPSTFKGDPSDTSQFYRTTRKKMKIILVYTRYFGSKFFPHTEEYKPHWRRCGCSIEMCKITKDKRLFNISDILIFHDKDKPGLEYLNALHKRRPKGQLWLWLTMECSARSKPTDPYKHLFDLTTSYRLNSDVMLPHRYYFRKDKYPLPDKEFVRFPTQNTYGNDTMTNYEDVKNYAKGKTGLLVFAASHSCNSYRKDLVLRLVKLGLNVTKYGQCRYEEIPQTHYKGLGHYDIPFHKYKFVLAFENSMCDDYITTRYWFQGLRYNTVPIVLGGGNYSDYRLAIPGTYIEAMKFSSPEKLAKYILKLDKNDKLYNKYFEYKKYYTFYDINRPRWCNLWLCEVCNKLHYGGWNLRKEPLSLINATAECDLNPNALRYYKWLNMKGDIFQRNRS